MTGPVWVKEDYRQWWLDRYTPEQIHKLARGLYGDVPVSAAEAAVERIGFCQLCEAPFELAGRGSSQKRFCSKACKGTWWETHAPAGIAWRQKRDDDRVARKLAERAA